MKKITLLLPIILLLFSCKKEGLKATPEEKSDSAKIEQKEENDSSSLIFKKEIDVETFQKPKDIDGCFCAFAFNKKDFTEDRLVYVDGSKKNAYAKINGKLIKIPAEKVNDDFEGKDLKINVRNKDFEIYINTKKLEEGTFEQAHYDGTIFVKDLKNKKVFEALVYGECGC